MPFPKMKYISLYVVKQNRIDILPYMSICLGFTVTETGIAMA